MLVVLSSSLLLSIYSSFVSGNNGNVDNCGVLVKSSCSDNLTTKWNKNNIGMELKLWIKGIQIVTSVEEGDKQNFNLRKIVFQENESKMIRDIINLNCLINKSTVGPIWQTAGTASNDQFHDGFLYGMEDKTGSITGFSFNTFTMIWFNLLIYTLRLSIEYHTLLLCLGNNITFVYPDMETVLIGQFENEEMVAAKPSKIIRERCHRGIKEIKVAKPKSNSPTLTYKRPNNIRLGEQPKIMDPFEKRHVYIKTNNIGDSVFAKKNIIKGDIIAYYSGLLWNFRKDPLLRNRNQTLKERYEAHLLTHFIVNATIV